MYVCMYVCVYIYIHKLSIYIYNHIFVYYLYYIIIYSECIPFPSFVPHLPAQTYHNAYHIIIPRLSYLPPPHLPPPYLSVAFNVSIYSLSLFTAPIPFSQASVFIKTMSRLSQPPFSLMSSYL